VELEEGPDIADNPAENLTLKARVEAASGLELANKLPSALYKPWLVFAEARAPFLQAQPGVFLAKPRSLAPIAETYEYYFLP